MKADVTQRIRSLEIRMSTPDIGYGSDDEIYPVARLLIDGVDMLAAGGRWGYRPWPAELILTDKFPLLPAEPSRRVVVYGEWPDPGGLAPQITSDGDVVVWSDFHEVYETGDDPLDFSRAHSRSPVGVPDVVFDARQYTAEVCRATAAREWESDSWRAARLLEAYLVGDPQDPGDRLTPGGEWVVGFAEPDRGDAHRYRVTYWTEDQRTIATRHPDRRAGHARAAGTDHVRVSPCDARRPLACHPARPRRWLIKKLPADPARRVAEFGHT